MRTNRVYTKTTKVPCSNGDKNRPLFTPATFEATPRPTQSKQWVIQVTTRPITIYKRKVLRHKTCLSNSSLNWRGKTMVFRFYNLVTFLKNSLQLRDYTTLLSNSTNWLKNKIWSWMYIMYIKITLCWNDPLWIIFTIFKALHMFEIGMPLKYNSNNMAKVDILIMWEH